MVLSEERKTKLDDDTFLLRACLKKAGALSDCQMIGVEDPTIRAKARIDLGFRLFSSIRQSENGLGAVTEKAIEYLEQLTADSKAATERSKEAFESSFMPVSPSTPPGFGPFDNAAPIKFLKDCKHPAMQSLHVLYKHYADTGSVEDADEHLLSFIYPISLGTLGRVQIQCPACHRLFPIGKIRDGEIETGA